ncbi:MAG: stage II sporulation protein E [Phycisphaerales bacterium]|nr:MAG: stage II sporulation protein E [Phycisphaerales bacterium]
MTSHPSPASTPISGAAEWRERLDHIVETMREMSRQTDPQSMVRSYGARMRRIMPVDRLVAISRRGMEAPRFMVTRDSRRAQEINPWSQRDALPVLEGGLLAELLYADEPRIINDLRVDPADPAASVLEGQRSMVAIPAFDEGVALNMTLLMRAQPNAFDPESLPELVWTSNLFGRATHNLVLRREVQRAYDAVDRELRTVADIQRSLLPQSLPDIPTMSLAAHYTTSRRAGGDYYDFFPLPDDRWGILIADVCGHGTPAAVLMAVTHSLAHTHPKECTPPSKLLEYVNTHLAARYTSDNGTFVTAFYGVYDPKTRELTYACAGHNPPRVKRCDDGSLFVLGESRGLPLGIEPRERYEEATVRFTPGDQVILYTDGVTEAHDPDNDLFGVERLDEAIANCSLDAQGIIDAVLEDVRVFTRGRAADDDRTIVVAKIR